MPRRVPPDHRLPRRGVNARSGDARPLTEGEKDDQCQLLQAGAEAVSRWLPGVGPAAGWAPRLAVAARLDIGATGEPTRTGAYGRGLLSRAWRGAFRLPEDKAALLADFVASKKKERESSPALLTA